MDEQVRTEAKETSKALSAPAGHTTSDNTPVVSWVLRGLTGAVNLLEGYVGQGGVFPEFWFHFLDDQITRLTALRDKLAAGHGVPARYSGEGK